MGDVVVVIGDRGTLGSEIMEKLEQNGTPHLGLNTDNCDVGDMRVSKFVPLDDLHSVICTAAIHTGSAVSDDRTMQVNALGPYRIAREIYPRPFHFVSSDYVLPKSDEWGSGGTKRNPSCFYGLSKAVAEILLLEEDVQNTNVVVYRCGPMFGKVSCRGKKYPNIIDRMLSTARDKESCAWSSGTCNITYAKDAASLIVSELYRRPAEIKHLVFNAVQSGCYSLAAIARFIYTMLGADPELVSDGEHYGHAALRRNAQMMGWEEAIVSYIKEVHSGTLD